MRVCINEGDSNRPELFCAGSRSRNILNASSCFAPAPQITQYIEHPVEIIAPSEKVSRHGLAAALPMENPYCSCKLTR